MKKLSGCIIKFFIICIVFAVIISGSVYIYYIISKDDINKYIPADYMAFIKIDSVSEVYNNLIDLRASDIILSNDGLKEIYKALLGFKKQKLTKNKFISSLLNMKVNIIINRQYKPVLIFDMGIKSVLIRFSSLFSGIAEDQKDFSLKQIKDPSNKYKYYMLTLKSGNQSFYISINKNLVFFTLDKADIINIYSAYEAKNTVFYDNELKDLQDKIKKGGIAEVYLNTGDLINPVINNNAGLQKYFDKFKFDKKSAVSFNISNEDLFISTYTEINTVDEKIKSFLRYDPGQFEISNHLPSNTNLFTALKFKSFEEFYKIFLYFQNGEYDETIKNIDTACKVLFKIGIDELLFSWIDNEIGIFSTDLSVSPMIFIKVKNKNKLNGIIDTLVKSIVFNEEKNLIYDGYKLNKIGFPDFIKNIVYAFTKKTLDAPYYTIVNDYIIFSMEAEPLADFLKKHDNNELLKNDDIYKNIVSKVSDSGNMFLYFNLSNSMPRFLQNNETYSQIIKLYEKGIISFNITENNLRLDLSASGINIKKAFIYPGYPKQASGAVSTDIYCKNILGNSLEELIYVNSYNELIVADINGKRLNESSIKMEDGILGEIIIQDINNDGLQEIVIFTKNSLLYIYNSSGYLTKDYPEKITPEISVMPALYNDRFLYFSKNGNSLNFYKDKKTVKFEFEFKSPLLAEVKIYRDMFLLYPKSFDGSIYLVKDNGKIIDGWPVQAGGIGFGSPEFIDFYGADEKKVAFITQAGRLNAWTIGGASIKNFPVKFEGVYYTQPVSGDVGRNSENEIVILDKDGNISVISSSGVILIEKKVSGIGSKDDKIMLFDADRNGKKDIVIYGGSNNITALDGDLNALPGFPLKGKTKPFFADINSDGQYEMITGSVDDSIYAWTIPNK